ncbi:MAG: HPr kinase/phosphatase C-terminal domain-containing protein [Sulfitobacter sp.]
MSDIEIIHATTVEIAGKAVLIIGPSGAGKSSLALQLMAMGAGLIADDRTQIVRQQDILIASVPSAIRGRIEARGVGLLRTNDVGPTPVALVVDLEQQEEQRLPKSHQHALLGVTLPCLHNANNTHFSAAIWISMQGSLDRSP